MVRLGGMLLPDDRPQTAEEVEAFLRQRRKELGIPESGAGEIQRRLWLRQLEAWAIEDQLPN
jgi:hypothetical protein